MPTTLSVAGFPVDASYRELKNVCRLCPGFEACSPNVRPDRPPTLFVKFVSEDFATDAILLLQQFVFDEDNTPDRPLKAEFARSELRETLNGSQAQKPAPQPHEDPRAWSNAPAAKRPRVVSAAEQAFAPAPAHGAGPLPDTLACKLENGVDSNEFRQFFESLRGFLAFNVNSSGSNCFAKFQSHTYAQQALQTAKVEGLIVDFAKRNLDAGSPEPSGGLAPPRPAYAPAAQPAYVPAPSSGITTLACKLEGNDQDGHRAFFEGLPGFEALKFNSQGSNCFVKFADVGFAQDALGHARWAGFTIDFAKRDLGGDEAHQFSPAVVAPSAAPPNNTGISTLAAKMEGRDQAEFEQFFSHLPGFVAVKATSSGSNCFVKFTDPIKANHALGKAWLAGFTLDFAKRDLEDGAAGAVHSQPQYVAPPSRAPVGAPPSTGRAANTGSTLACKMDGQPQEPFRSFFENLEGFEAFKATAAGSNCFVKFADYHCAQSALDAARGAGFILDFAKRDFS